MAFYTSRVDRNGNEIERRGIQMPNIGTSSDDSEPTSDAGFDYEFETKSFGDNFSLNNDMGMSDTASNYEYGAKHMSDNMSLYDQDREIVPPLDIRSEMNFSTDNPLTYKAKRKYETAKIIMEPNKHYEDWLARKRQRQLDAVARQKREEEEKQRQAEERKRLAEEKYQKWLQKKNSNTNGSTGGMSNRKPIAATTAPPAKRNPSVDVSANDKKKKLEEWMRNKEKQEHERRLREQSAKEQQAKQEAARKQRSNGAHAKWLERNKNAPKPVPLNQGFATLRGTVSKIFVNPNEWRTD